MDWSALWEKAPFVGALVIIVFMFLRHLDKRDRVLADISAECHKNQRDATEAIKDNTSALGEVRIALVRLNGR